MGSSYPQQYIGGTGLTYWPPAAGGETIWSKISCLRKQHDSSNQVSNHRPSFRSEVQRANNYTTATQKFQSKIGDKGAPNGNL